MQETRVFRSNIALARTVWPGISKRALRGLRELIQAHNLSIESGDLLYLDNGWYVTHAGLVRASMRQGHRRAAADGGRGGRNHLRRPGLKASHRARPREGALACGQVVELRG